MSFIDGNYVEPERHYTSFVPIPFSYEEEQVVNEEESKPARVVRMSGESFRALSQGELYAQGTGSQYWSQIDTVIVEGLVVDREGWLAFGEPNIADFCGVLPPATVLSAINTYFPVIAQLAEKYKHLQWMWQVPRNMLCVEMHERLFEFPANMVSSIEHLLYNDKLPVHGLVFSFPLMDVFHKVPGVWSRLSVLPCRLWCAIENEQFGYPHDAGVWELTYTSKLVVDSMLELPNFDYFLIPAFGFITTRKTYTNRGAYQYTLAAPESSLYEFKQRLGTTWTRLPRKKILMELSTSAVVYARDLFALNVASSYKIEPLRYIHKLVHDAEKNSGAGTLIDNFVGEYSALDMGSKYVSYDNLRIRRSKLAFAFSYLGGIVMGEPQMDLPLFHPHSLFTRMSLQL